MHVSAAFFLVLLLGHSAFGGKFLFYFPFSALSHKIALMPLVNQLAGRGHQITLIVPDASKELHSGVREIITKSESVAFVVWMTAEKMVNDTDRFPLFEIIEQAYHVNEAALTHPEVRKLIRSKTAFDIAVVPPIFCNEAGYFLAHKLNASLVLWSSSPSSQPWMNWAGGTPYNPSYMPMALLPFTSHMTFLERLTNTVASMLFTFTIREWYILPKVDELLARLFPEDDLPNIKDIERKVSLSLTVGNPFIADGLRPVLPNTVLAAFMSCVPGKPLPKYLQDWIDEAEHGVVYVSFGSVLKPHVMPEKKRKIFLKVLGSLKQRIIFKWEGVLEDKPNNMLTSSWLPQPDLLAHHNVRLFVTHGGAGSIQETICHKTPVVGIPIMADQNANLYEAVNKGFGVIIQWRDVTAGGLLDGITTVLQDDKYQTAVTRLGDLVMDQPQHPLDTATWWMEYVLRHPGNLAMRSPVHGLAWWQYFLLDVMLVVGGGLAMVGWLLAALVNICCRTARNAKNKLE